MIVTDRLDIVPVTIDLARPEIENRSEFAELLGATVPDNWPPDMLADALDFFLNLLEQNPSWPGWLGWYALERASWHSGKAGSTSKETDSNSGPGLELNTRCRTLIGSIGFKGPPDQAGDVEIGYSLLPQFQGKGYASEMAGSLVGWAFSHPTVRRVLAQTTPDNLGSLGVLRKLGFIPVGQGSEPNSTMFALSSSSILTN